MKQNSETFNLALLHLFCLIPRYCNTIPQIARS
nr:MAG TPA: hypothetical protein [Caudoviricetes sp.]